MNERKPRVCFCSSVRDRNMRQRLETSAAGPPRSRNPMKKTNPDRPKGEENTLIIPGPKSERVFQLPIPLTIKPRMEDTLRSGLSSSHRDLNSNENVLIVMWLI